MKTIFRILLLVLVSTWSMTAQNGIVSGNLAVSTIPTNNGNGTFTVVGIFSDPKGQYFAADVESALDTASFVFWKGNNFYLVDTAWASGSTLNLIVNDTYSTGFIPTGNAQILEITGNLGLPGVSTTGDSNAALATPPDHAALLNYIIKRIDAWASSIGGGGGGGSAGLVCGDTLTQAAHGFSVGDLLGQSPGNGPYFKARTSSVDSLPVTAVLAVVNANTFVVCEEGLFPGFTHGLPLGRDYFLQADGALDTIPDTTYQVFAFRTRSVNTAYFDIPELVIVGSGGGGGGVTQDADWYSETTGAPPTTMGQDIWTTGDVTIGSGPRDNPLFVEQALNESTRFGSGDTWDLRFNRSGAGFWVGNADGPTGAHESILFPSASQNYLAFYTNGAQAFRITEDGYFVYYLCPSYLNDAAADADTALPSGGLYQVTGDRTLRIKP